MHGERGSAMVLALLVAFILTLLGTSFLLISETESRIANNEQLATQALYVAEAGALAVKGWFDRPFDGMLLPTAADVDRTQRQILDETDPYGTVVGTVPEYKEGVDAEGDGDDLFRRPYRGSLEDAFMGTEQGPDIVIDDAGSAAEITFLEALSDRLVADFPNRAASLWARITRIEIYAPPYIRMSGNWNRFGLATVRVTARIYSGPLAQAVAERRVTYVINEVPYSTPVYGPVHTCGNLEVAPPVPVHWGPLTAVRDVDMTDDDVDSVPSSLPRAIPPGPRLERLWTGVSSEVADFVTACDGSSVPDPWLRIVAGGDIVRPTSTGAPPDPEDTWQPWPSADPPACTDHSGLVKWHPLVGCPEYDYAFWKRLATSGGPDVHYYAHDGFGGFLENGKGTARSIAEITNGQNGFFFFDTDDGQAPRDDDLDGDYDNLTPEFTVAGGWTSTGFIYLNSEKMVSQLADGGAPIAFVPPAEPFLDMDGDRVFDPGAEEWVNLGYPSTLAGGFSVSALDTLGGAYMWNDRGATIDWFGNFRGILYTNGGFEATNAGKYYGSVIARGSVRLDGSATPAPAFYWDASIRQNWPPADMRLPRVVITRWESER